MKTIHQLAEDFSEDFETREVETSEGVFFSQYETINTVDSYFASKFIEGQRDKLGRYKPFKQVIKPRVSLAHMATDISTKDINIVAGRSEDEVGAFILNILARKWMRMNNYGTYLNALGYTAPKYGSALTKFVEHKGVEPLKNLSVEIAPWQDIINNQTRLEGSMVIQKFYYSPSELRRKNDVWDKNEIEALITAFTEKNRDIQIRTSDEQTENMIEVWEVYADLPLSYYEKDGAEDVYAEQMHIISNIKRRDNKSGKDSHFILFKGKIESPFSKYNWELTTNRALPVGVSEDLFETQIWTNYTEKQIRDQLDIASKIFFQTADKQFAAKNVLNEVETGDIFEHDVNMPVTQVNANAQSITINQSWANEWSSAGDRLANTPEAMFGTTMPSGTAYRQVVALQNAANNSFKQKMQEKGLHIREHWMDRILPFLISTVNTTDKLYEELNPDEIAKIDNILATQARNYLVLDASLSDTPLSPEDLNAEEEKALKTLKDIRTRSIDIKDLNLKDIQYDVSIVITGEQIDKAAQMSSLNTALTMIASNPQILQMPEVKTLLSKILELSGAVSPIEIFGNKQPQQPQQPSQQPQQPSQQSPQQSPQAPQNQPQTAVQTAG